MKAVPGNRDGFFYWLEGISAMPQIFLASFLRRLSELFLNNCIIFAEHK
jgi:hypothetical protein